MPKVSKFHRHSSPPSAYTPAGDRELWPRHMDPRSLPIPSNPADSSCTALRGHLSMCPSSCIPNRIIPLCRLPILRSFPLVLYSTSGPFLSLQRLQSSASADGASVFWSSPWGDAGPAAPLDTVHCLAFLSRLNGHAFGAASPLRCAKRRRFTGILPLGWGATSKT